MLTPKNTRGRPVTRLCLALETFRRTDEGRARDAKAFLGHFFPQDKDGARDRLFVHMPKEVRADLLSNWGIRGKKSALRDDDDKVRLTVTDALAAGDIDANVIEEGVTPDILVDWIPLEDWWTFWRGSSLPLGCVRKALALGRELSLFDDRWFLENLKLTAQKLDGTDVICAALSKDQLVAWLNEVHTSGDATPAGLVRALGWETILAKTAQEALTVALDSLARQIGLVPRDLATEKQDVSKIAAVAPGITSPVIVAPVAALRAGAPKIETAKQPARAPVEPTPTAVNAKPTPATKPAEAPKPSGTPVIAGGADAHKLVDMQRSVMTNGAEVQRPAMNVAPPIQAAPRASTPPPLPASAAGAAAPASGSAPTRPSTPAQHLPSVIIELDPPPSLESSLAESAPPPAPISAPPTARALFGAPMHEPPPMRPPAATLSGVGGPPPLFHGHAAVEVAMPTLHLTPEDPAWAPPRAEPGDMGWDIVHGVTRSMSTNVHPKYNFDDDDEPTSEIALPLETGQG